VVALPALAASAPHGGPRPAPRLAVTGGRRAANVYPVIAVQQSAGAIDDFRGRGAWRWKMLLRVHRSPRTNSSGVRRRAGSAARA